MPETLEYIAYRLYVAGGKKRVDFTRQAAKLVYKLSGGVPRMINALCDRALLIGYTREQRTVTKTEVRQAMHEIRGEKVVAPKNRSVKWRRWLPAPSMAAVLVLAFVVTHYLVNPLERFSREIRLFNAILSGDVQGAGLEESGRASGLVTAESIASSGGAQGEAATPNPGVLNLVMARLNTSGYRRPEESLAAVLEVMKPEDTLRVGVDLLISLWNKKLAETYPQDGNAETVVAFFNSQGLACESLASALDRIYSINLPGLARMRIGDAEFWVVMTRMDEQMVTLLTGNNSRVTVSYDEFKKYYQGKLLVPWKDPVPESSTMALGNQGSAVLRFKEILTGLGRLDPENKSDVYDQETKDAVYAFQNEVGLKADGIAGRQMRLALSGWEPGAPALHPRVYPSPGDMPADVTSVSSRVATPSGAKSKGVVATVGRPGRKAKTTSVAAKKTTKDNPQAFEVIEKVRAAGETQNGAPLPPVLDMAAMSERPGIGGGESNLPGTVALNGDASADMSLASPRSHVPSSDETAEETAAPDAAGALMQVRELPEPKGALTEIPEQPALSVTKPVPGSMPLVPHEGSSSS